MNTEKELRKWLHRSNLTFVDNLSFGIKVWNSIEFVLLTKQEIIIDEFCNNLPALRKEIKHAENSKEYSEAAWTKINEFLSFRYSAGAVSVAIKEKLVKTLTKEAEHTLKHGNTSLLILKALSVTLHNTSMQNYYKSNVNDFAKFLGTNIHYLTKILDQASTELISDEHQKHYKEHIDQILSVLKSFIKQTPFLDTFKSAFAAEILQVLSELMISAKSHKLVVANDFLSILQELYFDGSQTNLLKQYFESTESEQISSEKFNEYRDLFERSKHVFLLVVEAVILSYRNDAEVQQSFLRYLFNENDGKLKIDATEVQTKLNCFTVFILLLKKYEVPLNYEIDSMKAYVYLGKQIENIASGSDFRTKYTFEVLNLLCAALKLNPLILEHSVCPIAVKFMITEKEDDKVWPKYEEFMLLAIEMYRRLSRAEKFISQLIKNLYDALSEKGKNKVKLPKKSKRAHNNSLVEAATPSKKLKKSNSEAVPTESQSLETSVKSSVDHYIALLEGNILNECENLITKLPPSSKNCSAQMWQGIAFALTPTISTALTQFISTLVSKPSLVVWKTLIFTLKDYVKELNANESVSNLNANEKIFMIEFTSALLYQYFMGARLAEQSDKIWDSIEVNRGLMHQVLVDFGHAIINQEHNSRTMNAFLKLCYSASNFDLVCWYYCPDSMQMNADNSDAEDSTKLDGLKRAKQIHSYLTDKEWTTIEQRITNFGKQECKANMNRIYLQRLKAIQLFHVKTDEVKGISLNSNNFLHSTTFKDSEQILEILTDQSLCTWFIDNLDTEQKHTVCELLLQSKYEIDTLNQLQNINDREFLEFLIFYVYKRLVEITANKPHYTTYLTNESKSVFDGKSAEVCLELGRLVEKYATKKTKASNESLADASKPAVSSLLNLLGILPIGFCSKDLKSVLALLNIVICRGLMDCEDKKLTENALDSFKALLHFDEMPNIFEFIKIENFIEIFKNEPKTHELFGLIFERVCHESIQESGSTVFNDLHHLLEAPQYEQKDDAYQQILLDIAVLAVVDLSKNKKNKSQYENFQGIVFETIQKIIKVNRPNDPRVLKTLPAFATIFKAKINAPEEDEANTKKEKKKLTELFKLFLGNTVDCKNQYSVKLLQTALENKERFELGDDLRDLIVKYWNNFKSACADDHDETTNKTMNNALKLIFDYKSTEEWVQLLTEVEKEIESSIFSDKFNQQSKILLSMAKCQYNKVKGQIFAGFFKNTIRQINATVCAKSTNLTDNFNWILHILECYTTLVNNVQTPVSVELIDDTLAFLTEINVKKVNAETFDSKNFVSLLNQMIALCLGLIQHRSVFILDRVPHFSNVFKDLLQTICWYKSNRSQHTQLDQAEVTMLAEMAHNLEKMNKFFVKHATEVKRVAPYLLIFVINLMISNERPTTLYSKIKMHIEYICYDLIAICDHRTNSFILRSCNEASKPVYENLYREYEKYFKFKGKV